MTADPRAGGRPPDEFVRKVMVAVGISLATLLLLVALGAAIGVLLLVFAGVLIAVFLRGLSDPLSRKTRLPPRIALATVSILLLAVIATAVELLAPGVAAQVDRLIERLPESIAKLEAYIREYGWGRLLLDRIPSGSDLVPGDGSFLLRVTGIFSTTLGMLTNGIIVLFVGVYVAIEPGVYTKGLLRLVPLRGRNRAREVLDQAGSTLRWWIVGRMLSMTIIGILTAIGLMILDIPLAMTLGLLAAVLTFVPYIGPVLSAVPAALLALTDDPSKALQVILLYAAIQFVESYMVTPLIQRRAVQLPPALVITGQVLLGLFAGVLGVVLATPLIALAVVLTRALYIEDALGDREGGGSRPGRRRRRSPGESRGGDWRGRGARRPAP